MAVVGPYPRLKCRGEPSDSSWKKCAPPFGQLLPVTTIEQPQALLETHDGGRAIGSEAGEGAEALAIAMRRARRLMTSPWRLTT